MRAAFNGCVVDSQLRSIDREGVPVSIEPKAFDLLVFLMENRHRVVKKEELIEAIWYGRNVSDAALTTAIRSVRKAIDVENGTSAIKTLARVGYHFTAEVDELTNEGQDVQTPSSPPKQVHTTASSRANGLPLKPSIAVIPFDYLTGDDARDPFTEGLTEDMITALSQFKELAVAGRNSSFALRDSGLTNPELGEQLGVRYLLKGSVRRAGTRMRITAQMIEAQNDQHIWARNYDRDEADIFDVQDDLTYTISCVILSSIVVAEQRRIESLPLESLNPWECYHRAYKLAESSDMTKKREALRVWERSLDLDPNFVEGAALLVRASAAYCALCGPTKEREEIVERAKQVAEHAIQVDPHHDLLWSGCTNLYAHLGETDKALKAAQKVMDLNPQGQHAHYSKGLSNQISGNYDEAVKYFQNVLELGQDITVRHPAMSMCAAALVNLGRHEEAIELCKAGQLEPGADFRTFIAEISAYGHLGQSSNAHAVIETVKTKHPEFGFRFLTYSHPFDQTQSDTPLYEGFRLAGLPA